MSADVLKSEEKVPQKSNRRRVLKFIGLFASIFLISIFLIDYFIGFLPECYFTSDDTSITFHYDMSEGGYFPLRCTPELYAFHDIYDYFGLGTDYPDYIVDRTMPADSSSIFGDTLYKYAKVTNPTNSICFEYYYFFGTSVATSFYKELTGKSDIKQVTGPVLSSSDLETWSGEFTDENSVTYKKYARYHIMEGLGTPCTVLIGYSNLEDAPSLSSMWEKFNTVDTSADDF